MEDILCYNKCTDTKDREGTAMQIDASKLYRSIPYVNKPVSRILYGTTTPALQAGEDNFELLDAVFALGINSFDLARVYKGAEAAVGRWIAARGIRDQVVLLSKCAHPNKLTRRRINERDIREDFEISTAALQTDYIDIYLLHRDDPNQDVDIAVEVMNDLHAEGKIGAFGGSNWTHRRIEAANEYAYKHNLIPFMVSSPNFGLAAKVTELLIGGVSIAGPENTQARDWYAENQMPVMSYSSLARGFFSGKLKSADAENAARVFNANVMKEYAGAGNFERLARCEVLAAEKGCTVAQIALAWMFGQRVNAFALVSAANAGRMAENLAALDIALTQEEMDWLDLRAER